LYLSIAIACQKGDDQVVAPLTAMVKNEVLMKAMTTTEGEYCGTPTVVMLTAGQHIDAGTVTVSNDSNYLYVTYSASNGYQITETRLYVGPQARIPTNKKGNPQIVLYPYGETFISPVGEVTYKFNLSNFDDCFVVSDHAVVVKYDGDVLVGKQTAWGAGSQLNASGSWAILFDYCKQACTDQPIYFKETAFAYGYDYATCFLDWGFSRWG